MKIIQAIKSLYLLTLTLVCAPILMLTSCSASSDEEVNGSGSQVVLISKTELSAESGNLSITYTGSVGTPWSAEIISDDDDFLSFSTLSDIFSTEGEVLSAYSNTLFIYYSANDTNFDRTATIKFTLEGSASVSFTLEQLSSDSESTPYRTDGTPRWNEIPTFEESDKYIYVTHSTTLTSGAEVRNFSLCYDIENLAAAWVAFPFHSIYDGNAGRNEVWMYDPKISSAYQPNLTNSYSGSYDRGHQIASADRQATTSMNKQTFYYSNMTPQLGTLNQNVWASLETAVRNQVCSDTLFVVTGADFTTTIGNTTDRDGKVCPLPGAYYKVMLRTRTGYTGKSVSDCSASELKAIGYWFEHRSYSSMPEPVSVKYIEEMTGFNFFPGVPDSVKEECDTSLWPTL